MKFVIQQYYEASCDPSLLDGRPHSEEAKTRACRMCQALMANEEALQAVLESDVILLHGSQNDSLFEMREKHYGQDVRLPDILSRFAHVFSQEDREWLQAIIKAEQDNRLNVDLTVELEPLMDCFDINEIDWDIKRIKAGMNQKINDFPEETQKQLRCLMEWTESTSISQIVIDAIEQHWKAVKRDMFGGEITLIKASGPGPISVKIQCRRGNPPLVSSSGELPDSAHKAIDLAVDHAGHGLFTAAEMWLREVFEIVTIEHKETNA